VARPPFLDALATAPRWQRIVLGLVAVAAFCGAAYFIAVLPVESRVTALRAQRDTQQTELVRLRAMALELTRMRREAAELERRLEAAREKLPSEREIPALYRTLSDAAVQAGLAVALFQPREPRVHDFYTEIPVALVAQGGYHELGDFIGRVASLPRATMVGELTVTAPKPEASRSAPPRPRALPVPGAADRARASVTGAGKPSRSVHVEMTLLTYVYRPVGSPPAPKPAGAAAKPGAAKP
jgi:type IV pilus assembly protein PilO